MIKIRFQLPSHLRATLRLAWPVMLNRLGILTIIAADTAMTGWAGTRELAALAISHAPHTPLLLIGVGLITGTIVLTSQAEGAGRLRETGFILRAAWRQAWILGIVLLVLFHTGEWILIALGQERGLAIEGAAVLAMFGWGMPAIMVFATTTMFLEAIGRPLPGMILMVVANVLNIGFNWVLIYGELGAPAMGAEGAAAATSIARWLSAIALVAWACMTVGPTRLSDRLSVRRPPQQGLQGAATQAENEDAEEGAEGAATGTVPATATDQSPQATPTGLAQRRARARRLHVRRAGRRLLAAGTPISAAHGVESAAFSSLTVFAGWLGDAQVAAFGIVINLLALPFMPAIGLATAANIRVGQAVGRRDRDGARHAAWTAVKVIVSLQTCVALGYILFAASLAGLYVGAPAVLAVAIPAVRVIGLALVPDALQAVLAGCLRGLSDIWATTWLLLLSFWGVMVPVAWWLGVYLDFGAPALVGAVGIGCVVAVTLLSLRLRTVLDRTIRPS